ncbi:MAG: LacI family DNA-binding transcriptional regulator [Acidimicrobiales bacterium]
MARAAGVSYQTVSRVINESPSVKSSTREAVLDAIARLGFRPNRAARALAGGPVQSVTVLASNTSLYGFTAALEGIEVATRRAGFGMGVRVVESFSPADVSAAVRHALEPAGALIVIAFDRPGMAALDCVPPDVPLAALIPAPVDGEVPSRPSVWIDEYSAAKQATEYLLRRGHRTVHHLAIPSWAHTTRRTSGWRAALEEAGVAVPQPVREGWDAGWGYEAGRKLAKDALVTAVLCGNDDIALGVMRAMHEAGRPVPDEVSIIGFDDVPMARFYTPALTTVRQDFKALGRVCFTKLLSVLNQASPDREPPCPEAKLIIRESTGPPPQRPSGALTNRGVVRRADGPNAKPAGARTKKESYMPQVQKEQQA